VPNSWSYSSLFSSPHTLYWQPGPASHHSQSETLLSIIKLKCPLFWFKVVPPSLFTISLSLVSSAYLLRAHSILLSTLLIELSKRMSIRMMSVGNVQVVLSAAYWGISSSSKQLFHAIELENIHRHVGLISHLGLNDLRKFCLNLSHNHLHVFARRAFQRQLPLCFIHQFHWGCWQYASG